jgi:ribosomal protein L16
MKRRFSRNEYNFLVPKFGKYALKALFNKRIKAIHVEAFRKSIVKKIKKKYNEKLKICFFTDLPVTKKSTGLRMGKGKGNIDFWSFSVKAGRILFEIYFSEFNFEEKYNKIVLGKINFLNNNKNNITESVAKNALILAGKKLPFKTKFIKN